MGCERRRRRWRRSAGVSEREEREEREEGRLNPHTIIIRTHMKPLL